MSRSINLDAAVDVVAKWFENMGLNGDICLDGLRSLPSAQPERSSEIQDILEYLDTVLHPIISPDHWNVYSELHDMISMLPSAQPDGEYISRQAVTESDLIDWYINSVDESEPVWTEEHIHELFNDFYLIPKED